MNNEKERKKNRQRQTQMDGWMDRYVKRIVNLTYYKLFTFSPCIYKICKKI